MNLASPSKDERTQALVRFWNSLSHSDRHRVSLDELCSAVNLSPNEFFDSVCVAAFAHGFDMSPMLAALLEHKKVLGVTVEHAKTPEGFA